MFGGEGEVPSNSANWEGGVPLQSTGVHSVTSSVGRFTIRGTFCEVVASQSCLALHQMWWCGHPPIVRGIESSVGGTFRSIEGGIKKGRDWLVAHRSGGPQSLCCHQVCEIVPRCHEAPDLVECGEHGLNQIVGLRADQKVVRSRRCSLHPCNGIQSLDQCARMEVREWC